MRTNNKRDLTIKKQIIMRKSYLLAAAVTMLTACTNNENMTNDLSYDGPVAIGFETFHEKSTKAAVTGEISGPTNFTRNSESKEGGFGVWGFKGSPDDIPAPSDLATYVVDLSNTTKYTTIFDNVQVWYENETTPTQGFTYAVPKYWDKGSEYIFFAYAPYNNAKITVDAHEVNVATLDNTTGKITIRDIASIQDVSTSIDNKGDETTANQPKNLQFKGSNATGITDYLMATYVTGQHLNATNEGGTNQNVSTKVYDKKEQTVGFTFGHMLSKFKINLKASALYSGVEYIKVDALSIENMPTRTETAKTIFTQTSPTAPAGSYNPNCYSTDLVVIGTGGTSTASLYILKNGSLSGETVTVPTEQIQEFNYYIAPSKANDEATTETTEKYLLNIAYTIHYVDGIEEKVTISDTDLSSKLTEFQQNNQYTLNILIGLNQIYFTVDAVTAWQTPIDEQEIEVK